SPSPSLPEIPAPNLDLTLSFDSILESFTTSEPPHAERVQKRASNVLKLTQENEKLKEELRAMTARLEAAERKRQEISIRQKSLQQPPQQAATSQAARSQGDS
ncbi:hypothetical protein BU15DRAFT_40217, partial [Melanogaster broomeanus]